MARNIINRVNFLLYQFEQTIRNIIGGNFPPALCTATANHDYLPNYTQNSSQLISLKDIIGEGFLWATPKTRRPLEVRMSRRFGCKDYIWKMLEPKQNIIKCHSCGHDHEAGVLCNHCYNRVKAETEEMQKAIINNLGLDPVEKEVIVLYEGEDKTNLKDYWKIQRIVELPKQRPAWFHSNLLQPSTEDLAESNEVKPTELA